MIRRVINNVSGCSKNGKRRRLEILFCVLAKLVAVAEMIVIVALGGRCDVVSV